jgi:hypothetical protein
MKAFVTVLAVTALALGGHPLADSLPQAGTAVGPFDRATVRFEQNATDGDAEVVFEVRGGAEGLAWLTITAPDGRTVAEFRAPDESTLGVRQFQLESPEPPDPDVVKAAYPEGVYEFAGGTAAGDTLRSQATLSHRLPLPATVLGPVDEAEDVRVDGLRVTWRPVDGAVAYLVTVEQEDLELSVTARLPRGSETFTVPDGFLQPGLEYQLAIGTVADDGNASFVESTFTTAGRDSREP